MLKLYEDDFLLLKGLRKDDGDTCIVSFTGVGHAMGGLDVQKEEFVGTALKNGNVLFVTDKTRSWSNKISRERLLEVFHQFGSFEKIVAIGNSMGGTNSLILGSLLGCKTVIAFTPQYSVHPDIFPDLKNQQWMKYRDSIDEWVCKSVDEYIPSECREYVFHGDSSLELMHARKFSQRDNRIHLILEGCGHGVSMFLKDRGVLSGVVDRCIAGAGRDELVSFLSSVDISVRN